MHGKIDAQWRKQKTLFYGNDGNKYVDCDMNTEYSVTYKRKKKRKVQLKIDFRSRELAIKTEKGIRTAAEEWRTEQNKTSK